MGILGPDQGQSLAAWVAELAGASPFGSTASPEQLDAQSASFENRITGGGFESWSAGTSAAPDRWTLAGSGAAAAREGTIIKHGTYSAKLTRATNDCKLSQSVTSDAGGTTYFRNRIYTLGCWVYATVADRVRLAIYDGVARTYSFYHPGDSVFRFLTVIRTMDASATELTAELNVDSGDTSGYFDGATLCQGSIITAFTENPNDRHLRISNYQSEGSNAGDQGIWRGEIFKKTFAGDTGASFVSHTITYGTAFRTIRAVLVCGSDNVGTNRVIWSRASDTTTEVVISAKTADATLFGSEATGSANGLVLGQV
jgi:hypothetical protein